jgi:hypothetical protein
VIFHFNFLLEDRRLTSSLESDSKGFCVDLLSTSLQYSNGGIRYCRSHCRQSSIKNVVLVDDDDIDDDKNIAR